MEKLLFIDNAIIDSIESTRHRFEEQMKMMSVDVASKTGAWGIPIYTHSHVDASWQGWKLAKTDSSKLWKPFDTSPYFGEFLVYMPFEKRKVHSAYRNINGILVIGGSFSFDVSTPSHWTEIPEEPII